MILNGTPGRSYALETSTNLVNWSVLTNLTHSAVPAVAIDPNTAGKGARLYRTRLLP